MHEFVLKTDCMFFSYKTGIIVCMKILFFQIPVVVMSPVSAPA